MSAGRHCEGCNVHRICHGVPDERPRLEALIELERRTRTLPGAHWNGDDAFSLGVRHGVNLVRSIICDAAGKALTSCEAEMGGKDGN